MSDNMVRVYDPPLCCSTGVCGPTVDPELVRFAADVQWLESRGARVERFNLAQQPAAFVENATILALLNADGASCLPVVIVGDEVVSTKSYPSREELAAFVNPPEGV